MEVPKDLLYSKDHEWIRVSDGKGVIGITHFAQKQLGDVVFVDLPQSGAQLTQGNTFGAVESVKTVSDLYAAVSGAVSSINKNLEAQPERVNADPYGEGWMLEVELSDLSELDKLMSPDQYSAHIQEEQP